jgi:regulator of replication initiation timing
MSYSNIDATYVIQELLNRNKDLMFENVILKARLAKYEQQEATQNAPPKQEVIPNGQVKEN